MKLCYEKCKVDAIIHPHFIESVEFGFLMLWCGFYDTFGTWIVEY